MEVTTSEFEFSIQKCIDSCRETVFPKPWQRKSFSKRLFGAQNTDYLDSD